MAHDCSTVEAVVQHYFDGLYEGSAEIIGAIFHPTADLRWLDKGEGKPRDDFIVTIDRSDESTAFIKVKCQLPPRYFTDYLIAMKLKDGWTIVSKSYRYDLRD